MKALNFYSSTYHGILVLRRKNCTIRRGDKTSKYQEGDLVWVTYGDRFRTRRKVFAAVIDRVEVKKLAELTTDDLRGEDPDMKSVAEAAAFLTRVYGRPVGPEEKVSVIYFSEVSE